MIRVYVLPADQQTERETLTGRYRECVAACASTPCCKGAVGYKLLILLFFVEHVARRQCKCFPYSRLLSLALSLQHSYCKTLCWHLIWTYPNIVAAVIGSSFLKCVLSGNCAVCWCNWLKVERGFVNDFTGQAESCFIFDTCVCGDYDWVRFHDCMGYGLWAGGLRQQYGWVHLTTVVFVSLVCLVQTYSCSEQTLQVKRYKLLCTSGDFGFNFKHPPSLRTLTCTNRDLLALGAQLLHSGCHLNDTAVNWGMVFRVLKWTFLQASFRLFWRFWLKLHDVAAQILKPTATLQNVSKYCVWTSSWLQYAYAPTCSMQIARHNAASVGLEANHRACQWHVPTRSWAQDFRNSHPFSFLECEDSLIACKIVFNLFKQSPWKVKRSKMSQDGPSPFKWKRGGYNKSPYMIAATVLGSLALVLIGVVPHSMLSVTMSET